MLIDTHTHLNDEKYKTTYRRIIDDLPSHNVGKIVCASYDLESSKRAIELSEEFATVYATVGTHPHEAKNFSQVDYDYYYSKKTAPKLIAIGEIGLDYYYDLSPRNKQKEVFLRQLELASIMKLPVIIHCRDAYDDALKILDEYNENLAQGILIHCFTGTLDYANEFLKRGYYLSFGGAITYKKNFTAQEVITKINLDNVLLETDCPYLTPVPYRGTLNEPKYVQLVADKIAEWKEMAIEEVENKTTANALRFFDKMK